jgi:hypothetical protein
MVITDKRRKPNTIDFGDLEFGDIFQDEQGDICMRIENAFSVVDAIVLSTGVVFSCQMDTPVIPLSAELIITNNK